MDFTCGLNTPYKRAEGSVRIMTYNIWGNYGKNCIANRAACAADAVLRYLPDVLGTQEVSPAYRAYEDGLSQRISEQYAEVEINAAKEVADGTINNITPEDLDCNFTALFYLRDRLAPVEAGFSRYAGLNDHASKSITWAVFEICGGGRFCVMNTHFYWKNDDAGKAARINNATELIALADAVGEKYPDIPLFAIGDFNCSAESEPQQILARAGFSDTRKTALNVINRLKSHHPYPAWSEADGIYRDGVLPNRDYEKSIDHILTRRVAETCLHITVTDQDALDSSDHCPVMTDCIL